MSEILSIFIKILAPLPTKVQPLTGLVILPFSIKYPSWTLKLNSPVYIGKDEIFQKQFGKKITIKYDEITDAKLSYAFYTRAPYAIKIYENNKRIMFEITSKVFDVFMEHCSNIEIKNQINSLLKENGIFQSF